MDERRRIRTNTAMNLLSLYIKIALITFVVITFIGVLVLLNKYKGDE